VAVRRGLADGFGDEAGLRKVRDVEAVRTVAVFAVVGVFREEAADIDDDNGFRVRNVGGIKIDIGVPFLEVRVEGFLVPNQREAELALRGVDLPLRGLRRKSGSEKASGEKCGSHGL